MKLKIAIIRIVVCALGAATALAQTLPTPAYTPVTAATADGTLRTPTTLWTANASAIAIAAAATQAAVDAGSSAALVSADALEARTPPADLWWFPSFSSAQLKLQTLTSGDGKDWDLFRGDAYTPASLSFRDPSSFYRSGTWWIAHTNVDAGTFAGNVLRIITSQDTRSWTAVTGITVSGASYAWSPELFEDADGTVRLYFAAGSTGSTDFKIYAVAATSSDLSTWSAPTLVFDAVNAIDPFIVLEGGTYYLFYKNETTKYLEVASSSTATGTFTNIRSGNWASWGTGYEGVSVSKLSDGTWRLYADNYTATPKLFRYASSSSLLSGWSAFTTITTNAGGLFDVRHGTPRRLTADQARSVLGASRSRSLISANVTRGGGGALATGLISTVPMVLSEESGASWPQFTLYHAGGTGSYKAATQLVSNDTWQGYRGLAASGGSTFLFNTNLATGAQDWYGDFKARGILSAGTGPTVLTNAAGGLLPAALPAATASTHGAVALGQVYPRSTSTVSGSAPAILSAAPSLRSVSRGFKLIADEFVSFRDDYSITRDGYGGTLPVIASGVASYPVAGYITSILPGSPKHSFYGAEMRVAARAAGGTKLESIGIGQLADPANNRVLVYYDGTNVAGEVKIGGSTTALTGVAVALTAPYRLAITQTQNIVAAWYDSGDGWTKATSWNVAAAQDFTALDLSAWRFIHFSGGTGNVVIDDVRAGFFGETGLSSWYEVTYEDGTPIWEGRQKFFAVAVAGLDTAASEAAFTTAHTAVVRLNVDTGVVQTVAKILVRRSISGTPHILGDSYGPIMFDRDSNIWRFFPQTTGNFTAGSSVTLHCTSTASLLSGTHILDGSTTLPLAASGVDPFWDVSVRKIGGTWYAAYSTQYPNFRPTVDTATSLAGPWTRTARDTSRIREGSRIVDWFGTTYILYANDSVIDVYDLTLTHLGTISIASAGWSFSTPSSHPMFFPVPQSDGSTKYLWITHSSGTAARPFSGWSSCYGSTVILDLVGTRTGFVVSPDIK